MNVSALLQESPSGDLRNRQQAQKQQQQQLQRQVTPQPQQTHDRRPSFDTVRDHDQKDREREREPDLYHNRTSSIPSRQQIDPPFPIGNSISKLNQPPHATGLGIGYPNDHSSSRAPHQLPPPSSLTGDLPDPGTRLLPPRDQPPPFPPREREPPSPFHSHHERPPPPPTSGQQGYGIDGRHHPSHPRPPSDRPLPPPFMPPPLDYPADRLKPLPKPINAHSGGSHPLFPTTVTPRQGNGPPSGYPPSRPKSPVSSNYSEQSSMFDGHHLPLPPPPPPSHSQHPRSRTSIIGQSSHPSSNRSSPAMGSLPRLDDHLPHPQNVGAQMPQSGNHLGPGSSLPGSHHPSSSSSPRTQNKMTTGPAALPLQVPMYHLPKPNGSPTREQRERDREYERWERERDWEREQRERSRDIIQAERGERNPRSGSSRGVPGYPDANGGPPRQTVSREEREWERHRERTAAAERERELQMRKEVESNSGFSSRPGPPTQRSEHPPKDHILSRNQQQTHSSHLQPHHNNPQQSHLVHRSHHHHHHHHHPRGQASKGKNKDLGSHKNQNVNPIVVVEPHHQHSVPHRPHYNEPPYKQLSSPKAGPNDLPIPPMNGPGLSPLDHYNQHIHHNQRTSNLHLSQTLPVLPPPSIITRPPSPQITHPIHLFPPSAPEPLVPGVHLGIFVYPRLPFPFFDFPEKVIVNVDKDGALVPDEVLANENDDPAKAAMLEDMVVLEKEVDREVRTTIILPWGLLYDELPTMFSKGESGWKGLNLWGGGIIPRGGTTPAEAQSSGPTIGGRRVYTDDSDLALCVLHSGFVNMGGMRKAKANKMNMKIEVRLSKEGRFVGGFGAAYHGGHPENGREGGLDGVNGNEEDGRRMLSGGWGNGHDGAGLEILAVEFIRGLTYSGGLWNRKQRLKEYAERRLVVSILNDKPYRGLDSRVWYDISGDDTRWMDNNSLVFSQSGSPTFKYNSVALKNALLPSLPKDAQIISRSRKRRRLDLNGVSTDPDVHEDGLEYGVVLETTKERFLVARHGKSAQTASVDGVDGVVSDKPTFTISLIQGEVEVTEAVPASSSPILPINVLELTPVSMREEPKSPLPAPEQPTKEPSPVEPLPPVSTPQESREVVQDSERGRSTSVVDMELDTPISVTPTATANPDIPSLEKILPNLGVAELSQGAVLQNTKPKADADQLQLESAVSQEKAPSIENGSAKLEAVPSKSPSPASVTTTEAARPEVLPSIPIPVPQPEAQGPPQTKLKLQILQRNVREEDLVFGDDGLGVLSADVDPLDNTKKGWLIEVPRWRRYNGRISDSIIID